MAPKSPSLEESPGSKSSKPFGGICSTERLANFHRELLRHITYPGIRLGSFLSLPSTHSFMVELWAHIFRYTFQCAHVACRPSLFVSKFITAIIEILLIRFSDNHHSSSHCLWETVGYKALGAVQASMACFLSLGHSPIGLLHLDWHRIFQVWKGHSRTGLRTVS